MNKSAQILVRMAALLGFFPKTFFNAVRGMPLYLKDLSELKRQRASDRDFPLAYRPILHDRYAEAGTMSGHYFHQDLLVARRIFERKPRRHVDIGSRIDGFAAHVAVFREIEIFDIRKLNSRVRNIIFTQADLTELPKSLENYCDSVSALHSIEHFGLGRYGDKIDYFGHLKALDNIYKILAPGGIFYFSVPIGHQRIEFNAHRVFSLQYLLHAFDGKYEIVSFSYVNDKGELFEDHKLSAGDIANNLNCHYGCGIFELLKNPV